MRQGLGCHRYTDPGGEAAPALALAAAPVPHAHCALPAEAQHPVELLSPCACAHIGLPAWLLLLPPLLLRCIKVGASSSRVCPWYISLSLVPCSCHPCWRPVLPAMVRGGSPGKDPSHCATAGCAPCGACLGAAASGSARAGAGKESADAHVVPAQQCHRGHAQREGLGWSALDRRIKG